MIDIDFIPASYHAAVSHKRRTRSQVALGAAMIVMMGLWLWTQHVSLCVAQGRLEQSRTHWAELETSRHYFDTLSAEREQLARRGDILAGLDDPASMVIVLSDLSGLLPQGAALTEISFDMVDARRAAVAAAAPLPTAPGTAAAP